MLRGILIRAIVMAGLPVAFLWPFGGLLFYLWYSHGRPNDYVWSAYQFDSGALLIAVTTIIGYVLFELRRSPPRLQGLKILILFWLWIALATLLATDVELALPKLSQYSHIFLITFLVAAMANSESRVRTLLYVMGGSIGFVGAKGAFDFIITRGQFQAHGSGGMMHEENEYALALNMAIPILFGLARIQSRRWARWMLQGSAVGCAITVIATRSRSGLLGLVLAILLLTFYSRQKVVGLATLALAGILFLKFAPSASMERYETIPTAAENDASVLGRFEAWKTALRMVRAHPFFGVGPLNFELNFAKYSQYTVRAPHNAFIALSAESGLPSCLLFSALIGSAIVEMWSLRRKIMRNDHDSPLATYCLIIQMVLTVYVVPNLFINRQNQDLMYHLIGVSAGLAAVVRRKLAEETPSEEEELLPEIVVPEPVSP
jgi:putative inorganic carbon (hco3(-)) transporter